jgi:hypothetical protein
LEKSRNGAVKAEWIGIGMHGLSSLKEGIVVEREVMAMKTQDKEREERKQGKNNRQDHVRTGAPP